MNERKELRHFGWLMGFLIPGIFGGLFPLLSHRSLPIWPFAAGAAFLLVGSVLPTALRPIHWIWIRLGHVMGWLNTRIILFLAFFLVVFPVALLMKVIRRDSMKRKFDLSANSYKIKSQQPSPQSMERPY